MSTDLEFRQGLPEIYLPAIKVDNSQSSDDTNHSSSSCIIIQTQSNTESDAEEECLTPTSPEHKIPAILSCPPAPRKPKTVTSCKRKLCELEFFEIVGREEIESFFRSSFGVVEVSSSAVVKRRCPCT
ncbi:cyclin-dependent protein kinase inhibitor SMR1 [Cornus florida]|uniref:cyclin-dependent protein kinase inhibitor SMR1 n=1 Tax=Cornus florida TaxID=4283 RepID=UPI00289BCD08|nr:cyclin-dependent protein kinase inhibitor SMR1 [Cornus florida]